MRSLGWREGEEAVRVARIDGVVVVGLVLNEGGEPAIADGDGFEVYFAGAFDVFLVLLLKVLVENGAVVTAVGLGWTLLVGSYRLADCCSIHTGEMESITCILRESAHESLQG